MLYMIFNANSACARTRASTGILTFKINSDGTLRRWSRAAFRIRTRRRWRWTAAGKFLFVAEGMNSTAGVPHAVPCPSTTEQYGVCVYAIGSGGSLNSR